MELLFLCRSGSQTGGSSAGCHVMRRGLCGTRGRGAGCSCLGLGGGRCRGLKGAQELSADPWLGGLLAEAELGPDGRLPGVGSMPGGPVEPRGSCTGPEE